MGKEVKFKIDEFTHNVWQCKTCKKEYVDLEQAKRYEKIERNMNYDGKTYFFREL